MAGAWAARGFARDHYAGRPSVYVVLALGRLAAGPQPEWVIRELGVRDYLQRGQLAVPVEGGEQPRMEITAAGLQLLHADDRRIYIDAV